MEELIFATFTKREEDDKEDLSYLFRDTSYYGTWDADEEDDMVSREKKKKIMKENKLLKPAILYKDEIERKYCEYFYSREMYQVMGCVTSAIPQIKASGNDPGFRQFAIVDLEGNCIGYLHYTIYFDRRLVDAFELLGFESTPLIGKALYDELYRLSHIYHLVTFGAVGSNPVIKHYMHACKKLKGSYVVERDVIMDNECNLDDYYRFQILNPDEKYVSKVNVISEDFSVKDSNDELTEDEI